ncbi:MAG: flagellar hook protein FlgE [Syntrophomonadaceae bacterium]|jgi:flagellar hook protein FlgE|nr:flagellar hook protein FlgE [Syntrophomonadaceae bacterium]
MMRAMYSVISGLRNHQTKMDVIGNNIANVNTYGFKKARVVFKDTLYQTMSTGSAPQNGRGGTNQMAVGLGMMLGSIDTICTPAPSQTTGKNTDLCINGNGYFLVQYGDEVLYTRSGAFDFDVLGQLCAGGNGALVMGWLADPNNNWAIDTNAALTAIDIGRLSVLEPKASDWMEFAGNLDAETPISDSSAPGYPQYPIVTSKEVTDSRGNTHTVYFRFFKTGATAGSTTWRYQISYNDMDFVDDEDVNADTCTLEFDSSGKLVNINGASPASTDPINLPIPLSNGAADISLEIDFSAITEHRGKSDVWAEYVTGYPAGELSSISIGSDGVITGIFSNEERRDLARIALATFQNPAGLTNVGESLYRVSSNSGDAHVGIPGEGDAGALIPGSLEMSNVDLSEEFVDMITTQRGFQANSRVITASDEMLQELVNLKR